MPRRSFVAFFAALALVSGCSGGTGEKPAQAAGSPAAEAPAGGGAPLPDADAVQGRWWTWAASEAEGTNPVADETGEFCARNQPSDVWFLAGTFGGPAKRKCTVPAGRPLVFPLVNRIADKDACDGFMAGARGSASLDGKPLESEPIVTEKAQVTSVAGNPVTEAAGTETYYACGIWVRLAPPSPGKHTLTFKGNAEDFEADVEYTLTVK
ncbi:signal protein [Bailinhaonella thermotolerans]|uniref:Signal protein n=1 Tax=Bailinhaonella thermotolerans TaxID=1070861 RepID=A0A3A4B068_9ACTN|nr:signal protein [Bailinhaonella thermotolerans]RJL33318.1 signal protein [Bailinhaonella thermotolerans]